MKNRDARHWLLSLGLCGIFACATAASAYEVRLTERRAADSLEGVVVEGEEEWSFLVRMRAGRAVEFRRGSRIAAQLSSEDADQAARVRLGVTQWSTRDQSPPVTARTETDLATATAIRETAIRLAELAPAPEDRLLRLTVLQLYSEVAKVVPQSRPRGASGRKLPARSVPGPESAECGTYTQDALFDCRDEEGEVAVVPFLDDVRIEGEAHTRLRHHQPDQCYGACGAGCGGKCAQVPVGCIEPSTTDSPGALCYFPRPEAGKQYRPSDDFDTSLERCAPGTIQRGTMTVCTAATCCFEHDECNRHDRQESLGAYLKCQMWGLRACGFSAVFGVPKTQWRLKWFRAAPESMPVELPEAAETTGICAQSSWVPANGVPHEDEQAICPIHRRKHTH